MYDDLIKRLRQTALVNCDFDFVLGWIEEAADAIEDLSRENESLAKSVNEASEILRKRWISVTERLPEPYTWALVSAEKHKVAFDAFYDGAQWKNAVLNNVIVTHWQPLPQPPKEEET